MPAGLWKPSKKLNTEKYHTVFHLLEETENFQLTDIEEIRFLELPKMLKSWESGQILDNQEAR